MSACGGCGAKTESERCIGCFHVFTPGTWPDKSSAIDETTFLNYERQSLEAGWTAELDKINAERVARGEKPGGFYSGWYPEALAELVEQQDDPYIKGQFAAVIDALVELDTLRHPDDGTAAPDDEDYVDRPALGRTHPYGTRSV